MDAVADHRLQQHFPVSVQDFQFTTHAALHSPDTPGHESNFPPYSLNLQTGGTVVDGSPQRRHSSGNHAAQLHIQTRSSQSSASGTTPGGSLLHAGLPPLTPPPPQQQPRNNLIFKNATSAYPLGTTSSRPVPSHSHTPYTPVERNKQVDSFPSTPATAPYQYSESSPTTPPIDEPGSHNRFSKDFPLVPDPPELDLWRHKLFNITEPLTLSEEEFLTYFPHVDNIYSHRSTQKYKRKPFVCHYWDCRLKGRPSGTPKSDDPNKKKRKRQARERDLCDVKIKITEFFGAEEARRLGLALVDGGRHHSVADGGNGPTSSNVAAAAISNAVGDEEMGPSGIGGSSTGLTIVMEDGVGGTGTGMGTGNANLNDPTQFGLLGPAKRYPKGHPGADGKKWFMIQRVSGNAGTTGAGAGGDAQAGDADEEDDSQVNLDHKHTLAESDRIKKNSVQRWLLREEKERKRMQKPSNTSTGSTSASSQATSSSAMTPPLSYLASGLASQTVKAHLAPSSSKLTFYGNSYCPFAQRIWIALEIKEIPYQYVEVVPAHLSATPRLPPDLLELNPDSVIPCIRHGNWAVWESGVMMEYLEDLAMGHSLLPLGKPQLRAHCRLWTDHINRKILPAFYSLLLTPPPSTAAGQQQVSPASEGRDSAADAALVEQHSVLITTLQKAITALVNASHATGPFFLGSEIGFVDVALAPWIIRLSRVLSYYRNFPRPEIGTRWQKWVDAIEADDRVRRTVSEDNSYHGVYRGVGEDGWDGKANMGTRKAMVEMAYARRLVGQEGFGLGGDVWGRLKKEDAQPNC